MLLFRLIKKLISVLLALALACGVFAGAYFGWQGWQLYSAASAEKPVGGLYAAISAQAGFTPLNEMSSTYVNAVIAVEDSRFLEHHGIDPLAIARAAFTDIRTRSLTEGGSTITQQLAKNELFTQEKHLTRKAAEMFAARDIEKVYSKSEIFEMYANTIYFGSGYYGIYAAAEGYFNKTPAELSDYEAVLLAGLPNAPSAYSPDSNPALASKRAEKVLSRMVECGYITKAQAGEIAQQGN